MDRTDDLTAIGHHLFVGFQNGVAADGGDGTGKSTLVEFSPRGRIEGHWDLTGKIDGLVADATKARVLLTVNEDGHSSLYTVGINGEVTHYTYEENPLSSGGGTDAIQVHHGQIYTTASNPSNITVPTVYQVQLSGTTAHLSSIGVMDNSTAFVANAGQAARTHLALTDPDSMTTVPAQAPRFAGSLMIDAQGDQQALFVKRLDTGRPTIHVLNLSESIDDTAFPTGPRGMLITTDSAADSVVAVTGGFEAGAAYASVTPGNSNHAPANPGPNHLGKIDLNTGKVSPVSAGGVPFTTHGLIYVP